MENLNWIHISKADSYSLPVKECVYMLKNNFNILYIGRSINLRNRLMQHKGFLSILLNQYEDLIISYAETQNSETVEKELIKKYKPLHNGVCRKKKISTTIEKVKEALDGRKVRWLSFEIRVPEQELSKKMTGKLLFTQSEIDAINTRLKSNIEF